MKVTPNAKVDDGLFDVLVVQALSRIAFLRIFPKVFTGEHVTDCSNASRTLLYDITAGRWDAELLGVFIPALAAEFGAKHAHLVAHSKGGLDVREFLASTIPPNFGVLSLTTLSTPHHGSVGADYALDSASANSAFSL